MNLYASKYVIVKIKLFFNIFIFHFLNHILDLIPALYVDVLIFPPPLLFLYNSRITTVYANPYLFISPFLHVRIL